MPSVKSTMPPSGSGMGWSWVKDALSSKADAQWVDAKLEGVMGRIRSLEKSGEDTKQISLKAEKRSMKHTCMQNDTISRMRISVDNWSNWWRKIFITVITAIVISGGAIVGWLYSHKVLRDDVDLLKNDVMSLDDSVSRIEVSQEKLSEEFKKNKDAVKEESQKQVYEIKTAFREVILELKDEKKKNKRGRIR